MVHVIVTSEGCSARSSPAVYVIMHGFSDHVIAQRANRYVVAFHIAILYDMQQPRYNGWAVGLRAACMVCVTLTVHCMC